MKSSIKGKKVRRPVAGTGRKRMTKAERTKLNVEFTGRQNTPAFKNIRRVNKGWINNIPIYLGHLMSTRTTEKTLVFEFRDGKRTFDAVSFANKKHHSELLKVGSEYTLKGSLKACCRSKKFNRSSNTNMRYSLNLYTISIVKEALSPKSITDLHTAQRQTLKEDINQKKTFTRKLTKVKIISGEIHSYFGCEKCTTGIPRPNIADNKYYCSRCLKKDGEKQGKTCFMIRNLTLEDETKTILENVCCFENECKVLLGEKKLDEFRQENSDENIKEAWMKCIGKFIDANLQHQGPNAKKKWNNGGGHRLFLSSITVLENNLDKNNDDSLHSSEMSFEDSMATTAIATESSLFEDETFATNGHNSFTEITDKNNMENYPVHQSVSQSGFGLALIINLSDNKNGAERNLKVLKSTINSLGTSLYCDKVFSNMSREELQGILQDYKTMLVEDNFSYSLMVVIGDGDAALNTILLKDGHFDTQLDIINEFGDEMFPRFAGKPKIFFFHASQHQRKGIKRTVYSQGKRLTDIVYMNSVSFGVASQPHHTSGSYFIQILANTLRENAHCDLLTILTLVQDRLAHAPNGQRDDKSIESPITLSCFSRKFYFPNEE